MEHYSEVVTVTLELDSEQLRNHLQVILLVSDFLAQVSDLQKDEGKTQSMIFLIWKTCLIL